MSSETHVLLPATPPDHLRGRILAQPGAWHGCPQYYIKSEAADRVVSVLVALALTMRQKRFFNNFKYVFTNRDVRIKGRANIFSTQHHRAVCGAWHDDLDLRDRLLDLLRRNGTMHHSLDLVIFTWE